MADMDDPAPPDASPAAVLTPARARRGRPLWPRALAALAAVYLFVAAINLMGHGLKTVAEVPSSEAFLRESVFALADHPLAGVCIGILLTSLVQSSSFTTTFTVGLVAAGELSLKSAIPVVMGANIGTSVTNTLVSLAHLRRRLEFRRSLAGATVHDFFNMLTVLVLLPLEARFGIILRPARAFADWLGGAALFSTDPGQFNLVKAAVKPVLNGADWLFQEAMMLSTTAAGGLAAGLAVLMLFAALYVLVKMLQGLMKDRLSGLFSRSLFRNGAIAFGVGIVITSIVQSSSVTTSLVVPLVGAGVLSLRQVFPYTLGANIGTTVTAILGGLALAAGAAGGPDQGRAAAGLAVAFAHLLFNIGGTCMFWPLQWVPTSLAKGFAKMAARRRAAAAVYIVVLFFVLPMVIVIVVNR